MRIIPIEEAVGKKLSHELSGISPGQAGGMTFARGYVVQKEDIETLKNMGKYHVKVLEDNDLGLVHENEAAVRLAHAAIGALCNRTEPKEGKVHAIAKERGVLVTDPRGLLLVNLMDGLKISAKKNHSVVDVGEKVASCCITPLEIDEEVLAEGIRRIPQPIVEIRALNQLKIGIVTTGNEVYEGRIQDAFKPYISKVLEPYGYRSLEQRIVPDIQERIEEAIRAFVVEGVELVFLTGGLSVDADDCTLAAVRAFPDTILTAYGSPVLPGAMFLAAYHQGTIPLIGLPAGLLRGGPSILDVVLPLLLAKIPLTKEYIASLGDGGLL